MRFRCPVELQSRRESLCRWTLRIGFATTVSSFTRRSSSPIARRGAQRAADTIRHYAGVDVPRRGAQRAPDPLASLAQRNIISFLKFDAAGPQVAAFAFVGGFDADTTLIRHGPEAVTFTDIVNFARDLEERPLIRLLDEIPTLAVFPDAKFALARRG